MPLICSKLGPDMKGIILIGLNDEDRDALDNQRLCLASRATNGLSLPEGLTIAVVQRETYEEVQEELVKIGMLKVGEYITEQRRPT